jgi:toxin YoeB
LLKLSAISPQIGKMTDDPNTRIKVVKDYLIIYEETETQIFILTIWDRRQDPEKITKGV